MVVLGFLTVATLITVSLFNILDKPNADVVYAPPAGDLDGGAIQPSLGYDDSNPGNYESDAIGEEPDIEEIDVPEEILTPTPEPTPLTDAEIYKRMLAGTTHGWNASSAIIQMDADYLYYDLRPTFCEVLADDSISIDFIRNGVSEAFQRNGNDEETSLNMANGFIEMNTQPGACN